MKVLLVTPENRFIRAFRRGQLNTFAQLTMPYLAGFVGPPHSVALADEYVEAVHPDAPADLVGITRQTSVLAYQFGDGFSNIFTPTSGYFMAALDLALEAAPRVAASPRGGDGPGMP